MADGMHLGDEVELITDRFASIGARRGSICVIVDDWADGSNDVEYCCPDGKDVPIRFRAAEGDIRAYTGTTAVKEPRKHGLIFGRGDDLGAPPGDPPAPPGSQLGGLPIGGTTGPWFGSEPAPAGGEISGDIPWELRDEPPSEPVVH